MEIDPDYGDDLLAGFSDDERHTLTSNEEEGAGDDSLDLLTAILEGSKDKPGPEKERKAVARKRRASSCNQKGAKRRKSGSKSAGSAAVNTDSEGVAEMKARMKQMEAELAKLREQVSTSKHSPPVIQRPKERVGSAGTKRFAHQPAESVASKVQQLSKSSRQVKTRGTFSNSGSHTHTPPTDRSVSNEMIKQRQEDDKNSIYTEKYSGLRIKNPLVSSEQMAHRMSGRKMVKIPRITKKIRGDDIEGDWVTIGVIVDKLSPRDTKKGDKYTIWKLSDLSSTSAVVSLFLFGKAYQDHWKTAQGSVIALLNPSIMPDKEDGSDSSSAATNYRHSNIALSVDHPQKVMLLGVAYEFTTCKAHTKSGKKCTQFAKTSDGGYCDYHIQSAYSKIRSHRMEFQHGYGPSPNSGRLKEQLFKKTCTELFYYGGQTFTAGSGKSSGYANDRDTPSERLFAPGAQKSVTGVMREVKEQREAAGLGGVVTKRGGVMIHEGSEIFKKMLQTQSAGARMLNKHYHKEEVVKKETDNGKIPDKPVSRFLQEHGVASPIPQLGRGISRVGGVVDLGNTRAKKPSLAKLKALLVVRQTGPIKQEHSTERQPLSNKKLNDIEQRVETNFKSSADHHDDQDRETECKKSGLDSSEVQRIMNARSSHDWVVKEAEWDKEQEYFDHLEKKENIEERMASITELRVSVVRCRECKYTAESPSELCMKEKHALDRFKVTKKCFKCKQCSNKCYNFTSRLPVDACRKCGGTSYEPTSFYRERKGPKLPTEELLLRGVEEKFLH